MVSSLKNDVRERTDLVGYTDHSRSARPMKPSLIPLCASINAVLGQLASDASSPKAGSRTFASSQGNLHWFLGCLNWETPKSRS